MKIILPRLLLLSAVLFQLNVGYCPQYNALLNHLTGREMLRFYAKLTGVVGEDLERRLIKMVEIEDYADELIKYYSFVNKRKLAVAVAVIGFPAVLILDEPTTGLDFESRKIIWNFLMRFKCRAESAIIFSSTSFLECQQLCKLGLCNRLAVMTGGTFQCIGSFQELEAKYNSGKLVKIILKPDTFDLTLRTFEVRGFFESNVPRATLLNCQEGIFTYHVGESFLKLSALFHLMDYMKMKFNLHKYLINDSCFGEVCFAYLEGKKEVRCF